MKISILTASLNMLSDLRRCVLSVQDQEGVSVEHIVVDGGSHDGTPEWLASQPNIRHLVRKDKGMYDALNTGIALAEGDVIGMLNCDEQYLPGALATAGEYLEKNETVDVLFGDFLVIGTTGELIAFRKGFRPRWSYIASSYLYTFTCTMFVRKKTFERFGGFDTSLKMVADAKFILKILRANAKAAHVPTYLAAFTMREGNLGISSEGRHESRLLSQSQPLWLRATKIPLNVLRLAEKAIRGAYFQESPLRYSVYVGDNRRRNNFLSEHPSFRWRL